MSHRNRLRFGRRALLGGLGASALAPFIPLTDAEAGGEGIPKRLIMFYHPFGTFYDQWSPTTSGSGTLVDGVQSYDANEFDLDKFVTAPLQDHKDDLVVLDGLRIPYNSSVMPGDPHQAAMALLWSGAKPLDCSNAKNQGSCWDEGGQDGTVGWGGGVTVDQYVVQRLKPQTPFGSLVLGVDTPNSNGFNIRSAMSYSGPGEPIAPQTNPADTWQTIFGDFAGPDVEVERRIARRQHALGTAYKQLQSLSHKVSAHDRMKIENHLDHVASIEGQLQGLSAACEAPDEPNIPGDGSEYFMEMGRAQIDMIVAALACDATRVASLQLKDEDGGRVNWLDPNAGVTLHGLSHSDGNWQELMPLAYRDFTNLFAYLLEKLAAVPSADGGRLLDHTLVAWGSALGSAGNHDTRNVPFVLAGGAQGAVDTGRYLVYDGDPVHNRLLVSILDAMGIDDTESFGNHDSGSGLLPAL